MFVEKISKILDQQAPLKNFQARRNCASWLSEEMKSEMKERDNSRELARRTQEAVHWKNYKMKRNKCSKNLKNLKIEHHRKQFLELENENDTKNIYKMTRNMLNWKTGGSPQCFLLEGQTFRKPVDLANLQLKFFNDKVDKLTRGLGTENINPLKWLITALDKWRMKGKFDSFKFHELSLSEILKLISKMGNSTSLGTDYIDSMALKSAAVELGPPLRHLVNTSLRTSTFANKWKLARLVPLLKSKELNKLSPSSYRPIAILPATSKLIEKAAQEQLMNYFENHGMLNDSSHAYRKGYSTTTTLLEITEKLYSAIDDNKISSVMTLDQSAAFDCVSFEILLRKLELYNLDKSALKWLRTYLYDRTQFVTIGRASSRMTKVSRGVPQGSVLGPLLYSIYTNELSEVVTDKDCKDPSHKNSEKLFPANCSNCGSVTQYADDATFVITDKVRSNNQKKLSENIEKLGTYLKSNELSINKDKTQIIEVMIQQKKAKTPGTPPELNVMNNQGNIEVVKNKTTCRILGMNVQHNMTMNDHLETGTKSLLPCLRRSLGALKSLGRKVPMKSRNILARGLLLGRLQYLVGIWGGATANLINKAQIVQNAAARWVTGHHRRTRVSTLLEATGWLSIPEMSKMSTATQLWKVIYLNTPKRMSEQLSWNNETKLIATREPRLLFSRQNFNFRATTNWNTIPEAIRTNKNLSSFKKQMKQWIIDQRLRPPE